MASTIAEIMTTRLVTIEPQNSVATAIRLMRQGELRRLPVVENGKLVGMVTSGDLRRITGLSSILYDQSQDNFLWRHIPIGNVMSRDPIILTPETPISDAASLLIKRKISGFPVVQKGVLVGIITTSDLLETLIDCERQFAQVDRKAQSPLL
ncbi:MAG: CBS domain-containing protein [Chloroflexota bacterium]|nr:CBS domain-containing protein [Chloroflexota bacterium]